MLDCQKHLFSLPDSIHYLNCAYMSPLLKSVEQAGFDGISRKRLPYLLGKDDFFTLPYQTRQLFAELVHSNSAEQITLLPSVSYGMAIVAKNLQAKQGQNIVSVAGEFPSNIYAWKPFIQNGVELRLISPPQISEQRLYDSAITAKYDFDFGKKTRGEVWNEAILDAIDDNTALVVLCPIHWADGTLFDLEVIGEAARSVGAMFIIDATQALGAMPFDVHTIQPDAVIAASYKCMMGAYSIGCAYWGERFTNAQPLEETWIGRLGSEDFRNLVNYQELYQPGNHRLNMGEYSNFALVPMLNAALKQLLEWQPNRVQEYCASINRPLINFCSERNLWVEEPHWRAEHLFGIKISNGMPLEALQQALAKRNIFVSLRGDSIRVSPSVYNTQEDIIAFIEALEEGLGI